MYYLLSDVMMDDKNDFYFSGVLYDKKNEIVSEIFDDGILHDNMNNPYTLILDETSSRLKKRRSTDKIVSSVRDAGFLFLVSQKTQDILNRLVIDEIKMYEVKIRSSNLELTDYKIVKITDKIDCVDMAKSDIDFEKSLNFIFNARSLVFDDKKIPDGKQIFLLGKRPTGVIVIHENLKTAIEKSGLSGFYFYSLDDAIQVVN